MRCCVCEKEIPSNHHYCDRCRTLIVRKDQMKRRAALRKAYDRSADGFRCHWSGVILEEEDRADPFHLCFDHLVPEETSGLVVSSELFNQMKFELAPEEFPRAIRELAAHRTGRPFDRDFIEFKYWRRRAPSPPEPGRRLHRGEVTKVLVPECVICGRPPKRWSYYCPRCRRFLLTGSRAHLLHARAMKEAWSADEDGFVCHYTGVRVDEADMGSPWYLSFDHGVPRDDGTLVVAACWVNAMKTALSENEFWKVVEEYDRYLREGGEFDKDIVEFRYWRRASGKRGWTVR